MVDEEYRAKGVNLKLTENKKRIRYGCDSCKRRNIATEKFIGFCHNELYLCGECRTNLQTWDNKVVTDLAEQLHDKYEEFSQEEGWETQKKCRVQFKHLPEKNKVVMIKLAGYLLEYHIK